MKVALVIRQDFDHITYLTPRGGWTGHREMACVFTLPQALERVSRSTRSGIGLVQFSPKELQQ